MSLNIQTNMSSSTKSLSDHGAFRNSMYQRDEEKKNKKTIQESVKVVHEEKSNQFFKNDKIRMKSAGLNIEISNIEEEISNETLFN